jgi:catechol 2,3-dioxygenase-like lactoylglutathione lyase family enzyme
MIAVAGLYESHLTVADLDRSIAFYREVVGLELAHRIAARNVAFMWIGARERSMLGLWSTGSAPLRLRLHIAFTVTPAQVDQAPAWLRAQGVVPRDGGGNEIDAPVVFPWMPAASVYFDDPDGHSLEYIALLAEAPRPEMAGTVALSAWRALHGH